MAEGEQAGEEGEGDAAENGLVINVGAAAEEEQGAAEAEVGGEENDGGGRGDGGGRNEAPGVAEQ